MIQSDCAAVGKASKPCSLRHATVFFTVAPSGMLTDTAQNEAAKPLAQPSLRCYLFNRIIVLFIPKVLR
jgi:hypothetical protein